MILSDRQTLHCNANFKEREVYNRFFFQVTVTVIVTELEHRIVYVFTDWCTYSADTFNFDKAGGLHALLCDCE